MNKKPDKDILKKLPKVDYLLDLATERPFSSSVPRSLMLRVVRIVIDNLRQKIINDPKMLTENDFSENILLDSVENKASKLMMSNLRKVINATGVVIHTNFGRSLIANEVIKNLITISTRYSNLEFDLATGTRGSRYNAVEDILCELTGAESAMIVNNNAGAVFLCLQTLAQNMEVVVSRGELVEIGGSFRIPDVMSKSGALLKEVGTTNRTHLKDYENAVNDNTGLLLKVHTSNYGIIGFTASVPLNKLVSLGKKYQIPVMEDLGSGNFIDFTKYGFIKEPTVQETVATGADIVTFSGDKMLGGPQAGIILGKTKKIEEIKKNPINRALRIDKMTLAVLEGTLRLYRDEEIALKTIPTLCMLTMPFDEIAEKTDKLLELLRKLKNPNLKLKVLTLSSRVGGGALPLQELPSKYIGIQVEGMSVNSIERFMREYDPPIIGRIEDDMFIMDLRTIQKDEIPIISKAFEIMLQNSFESPF
ncbi:L-seryl-tRNA(Sec) selenium transferase [Candidatus Magnetomoraceae bacterium gMMP-15]